MKSASYLSVVALEESAPVGLSEGRGREDSGYEEEDDKGVVAAGAELRKVSIITSSHRNLL